MDLHGSGASGLPPARSRDLLVTAGQQCVHLQGNMSTQGVARSKDGVPTWDGEAGSFNDFEEAALMWEQSIAVHKRYLCGPRLQAELTGSARRLVAGKPPAWVSHNQGVRELMHHLRSCLGKPQIAELSEYLNRYFKGSRRKPQETINDYVTRKCEVYLRAQQALRRVAPFQEKALPRTAEPSPNWGWSGVRRTSAASTESAATEAAPEIQSAAPVAEATEEDEATTTTGTTPPTWSWWQGYGGGWGSYGWQGGPWWGSSSWQGSADTWGANPWRSSSTWSESGSEAAMPDLLPDFVQGWYLLQDSGLSTSEKNIVQTALQGDFSLQKVAQELRNQWPANELQRREGAGKHVSYLGDYQDESAEEHGDPIMDNFVAEEQLDDAGMALWAGAESEAQTALALLHGAKKTLKKGEGSPARCPDEPTVLQDNPDQGERRQPQ